MRRGAAARLIRLLELQPHPEGGFYRETYRAADKIPRRVLPSRFPAARSISTAILFLLRGKEISRLHRLKSDELWHYYTGGGLRIHVFEQAGGYRRIHLGRAMSRGAVVQAVVPAGCWFGATVAAFRSFALVGCTVAPGFDFADCEFADRESLLALYPQQRALIRRLTQPRP
jgi:predicted cupin superfamily sugar epimerase